MGAIGLVFSGTRTGITRRRRTVAEPTLLRVPMAIVPAMATVAEHMKQRTSCQQQKGQIRQTECEVSPMLGKQVERGNREQKPERNAPLPPTLGVAVGMFSQLWAWVAKGWVVLHHGASLVKPNGWSVALIRERFAVVQIYAFRRTSI